ncbi:Calerythrin [Actinomadura rubteroloni]|uniref:Calerythrin n=1 Tax=Actinomadura rubteroloni TaxID=1926885 RepID=A0A2P4ULZ6_9ACTN|nr:EF-hand domain-containing protein [Actinomadura rubteroloni]POM26067.1 Calerythrin [Actinomadura rubteroloni]
MEAEIIERLRTRFDTLDGNGNGFLEKDDFDDEVTRIVSVTGVAAGAPRAQLLRDAYRAYWWAMLDRLDKDGDGRISFEEYAEIVHAVDDFKSFAKARADAVDRFTDFDGDGWIERDDYLAVMVAARFDPAAAGAAYDALVPDQAGKVRAGRYADLIMEFYDTIGKAGAAQLLVPPQ